MTALSVLLTTTGYKELFARDTFTGVTVVLAAVAITGFALTVQAERKVRRITKMIERIEKENKRIAEIVV